MAQAVDWAALRQEFPTLAKWTYLDVARNVTETGGNVPTGSGLTHQFA